jgi:hypothetical protein
MREDRRSDGVGRCARSDGCSRMRERRARSGLSVQPPPGAGAIGLADVLQEASGREACLVADLGRGDPACPGAQPRLGLRRRVATELDDGVDRELAGRQRRGDPRQPGEGVGGRHPAVGLPPAHAVADRDDVGHVARPGAIPGLAVVGLGDRGEQLALRGPIRALSSSIRAIRPPSASRRNGSSSTTGQSSGPSPNACCWDTRTSHWASGRRYKGSFSNIRSMSRRSRTRGSARAAPTR